MTQQRQVTDSEVEGQDSIEAEILAAVTRFLESINRHDVDAVMHHRSSGVLTVRCNGLLLGTISSGSDTAVGPERNTSRK